jgi:hypothetical protein
MQPIAWLLKSHSGGERYRCTSCPGGWLVRWLIVRRAVAVDPLGLFELLSSTRL